MTALSANVSSNKLIFYHPHATYRSRQERLQWLQSRRNLLSLTIVQLRLILLVIGTAVTGAESVIAPRERL
jgi:hypothetical protein